MKCLDVSFFSCWTLDTLKVTSYYSTITYISLAGCLVVVVVDFGPTWDLNMHPEKKNVLW